MYRQLLKFSFALFISISALGQTITTTRIATDDSANPLLGGSTNKVILGFSVDKTAGAVDFTNLIVSTGSTDPSTVFSSVQLWTSATNFAAATNTNATVTLNPTNITFAGNPTNLFSYGAGVVTGRTFYVVASVRPDVATTVAAVPSIALSFTDANTTYTGGPPTETAFTVTGTTYNFLALSAAFTQNADDANALGGQAGINLMSFSILSNGSQNLTPNLVFTFNTDVTNILQNFNLQVGGVNIAGSETYTLNGAGTQLTIAAFTPLDVSTSKSLTLLADVKNTVLSSNDFVISLASSGVTANQGFIGSFATFTNSIDVTALESTFTQNADDPTALVGQTGVNLLAFTVLSNGTQDLTPSLVFTFNTDVSNILQNFNLQVGGVNVPGAETYTLNGAGTQLTIAAFSNIDVTTSKSINLLADIKNTATSASDFVISFASTGAITNPGFVKSFATFTNSVDVTGFSSTFVPIPAGTNPVIGSTVLSAGATLQVLTGFSITSNGTQTISAIDFNYTPGASIVKEYLYKSTTALTLGSEVANDTSPDGNFTSGVNETITTTTVWYYLVVDVAQSVTSLTTPITIAPTQAGISISPGTANAFSINRPFTFNTSQASDIVFTGGASTPIIYRLRRAATIDNTDLSLSQRLATFQLREGGGATDGDDKKSSITSITMQITKPANIRRIALFIDESPIGNLVQTEIPGTEQNMPGSGTVVFTPSSPIRTSADDSDLTFMVRVTFNDLVTDNDAMVVTITSVTGEAGFSGFLPPAAGGANSSAAANKQILVVATKLAFSPIATPPSVGIGANFGPLTVNAFDGLNNLDVDFTGQIDLTRSGGAGTLSSGQSLSPTITTNGQFTWTTLQLSAAGAYTLKASDDAYVDALGGDAITGSFNINSASANINPPALLDVCYNSAYQPFPIADNTIVITETDNAGFASPGGTFSLALPTGFEFDQSVTTAPTLSGGSDISSPSTLSYPAANIVQFSYVISGSANLNSITITGLKLKYNGASPSVAVPPTNITRFGGTAVISGNVVGTAHGQVSYTPTTIGGLGFTVVKINAADVDVAANETRFSQSASPVRLVGSPGGGINPTGFAGSGVTFISGEYRFNPQSLAPGIYPITFTYTDGTGQNCQYTFSKPFEVYTTNITNLNAQYCNNAPQSLPLNVTSFLTTFYPTFSLVKFVYWNPTIFGPVDITSPANNIFDPKLPAYQPIYSATGSAYGTIGIWIGFVITDGVTTRTVWQLIPVRPAPTVSFTLPKTSFCADETPVTLVGSPPNSNVIGEDFFTASPVAQLPSVTSAGSPVVWSFNPAAVSGVSLGSPVTFDITYTYRDPATGCSGTSLPKSITVASRPSSVLASSILSAGGVTQQICQGAGVISFIATSIPTGSLATTYNWYSDNSLLINKGSGNSFLPPVNNTLPTPPNPNNNFYVTRTIAGCESDKGPTSTPLQLAVIVNATPGKPVPDFNIAYCVNDPIAVNDFKILGGTNIKWYKTGSPSFLSVSSGSSPTLADIQNILGVSTTTAGSYSFNVTQTASGCEGILFPTTVKVTVKALPKLLITADANLLTICKTNPVITLTATDGGQPTVGANGLSSWVGVPPIPSIVPDASKGTAQINPSFLTPDNYSLTLTYTDNTSGCANSLAVPLKVLPTISPALNPLDFCDGQFIRINNGSTVDVGNLVGPIPSITKTQWNFSDGSGLAPGNGLVPYPATNSGRTKGTYFSPEHRFNSTGSFNVSYTMETSDGCSVTATKQIIVNPKPIIDFTWKDACRQVASSSSQTQFNAATTNGVAIATYQWNFKVNNLLTHQTPVSASSNPVVKYTKDGKDIVELIVISTANCRDTVQKPVYIVPSFPAISVTNSYAQAFDQAGAAGANGWLTGGRNSSWALGTPNKTVINSAASSPNAWVTNLSGNNNTNESSWVLSRCFDFKKSTKPVISLDIWSNTPAGLDGAVLQYNEDRDILNDASWKVVGTVGAGINWYDNQGISNSPGNQSSNDLGWSGNSQSTSGKYSQWRKAVYKLDNLIGKDSVTFRIAFASSQARGEGFAFDNLFIGERTRTVLIENFTNSSSAAGTKAKTQNDFFNNAANFSTEIVKVQYHTTFPGEDPINKLFKSNYDARSAFYGINISPSARIDGESGASILKPEFVNWGQSYFDDAVLKPANLKININAVKDASGTVQINTVLTPSPNSVIPANSIVYTMIVEKTITDAGFLGANGDTQFSYVVTDILPNPSGYRITQPVTASLAVPTVNWNLQKYIFEDGAKLPKLNNCAIVVFVQSDTENSKNVYQSAIALNPPHPNLTTGIEDGSFTENDISLFPNPANQEFILKLPKITSQKVAVKLIDQLGKEINSYSIGLGEREQTISTRDLSPAIYIIQLETDKGTVRKKVMVAH